MEELHGLQGTVVVLVLAVMTLLGLLIGSCFIWMIVKVWEAILA